MIIQSRPVQLLFALLAIGVFCAATPTTAVSAVISTGEALALAERETNVERVNRVLQQESVRELLVDLGVDPIDASLRVASLADHELALLAERLEELPAGGTGIVEVVGIVAIVLVVLELLDVTNIFNSF